MTRKTLLTSIVCGLLVLIGQPMSLVAASPSLAGSWQFTLTPATPASTLSIPGLATLTTNGSLIETDGTEVSPGISAAPPAPTYGTPGHGIWQLGPCMCNYYVQYFSLVVNADGSLYATNVTTATVTLASTGTQFSGTYTTIQEAAGSTKEIASGAISGTLIPHPKLP
jgi:hypothetical protein